MASSQKYELVFPDGHVIRFADFNERVNYVACKPFHKPLSFNGRIVDNLASWKIVVSPDKATYRIGLHFEKETIMIPVEVVLDKTPQIKEQPSFVFPFGTYFPTPGVWKVEGTEIVKLKAPIEIKVSNNKNFAVRVAKYDGEKLQIELSPLFKYDTTDILSDLSKRFNRDVELTLFERKTGKSIAKFKSPLKVLFLPYSYDEVVLLIPGSEYTLASKAKFSPDGKIYPYDIKDKPYCKIIVKIDGNGNSDLMSRLNKGKDVGVIEWEIVKETRKEIKNSRITGNNIGIKVLPNSNLSIRVRLAGYKPISETINNYNDIQIPKIITVRPKLKLNKRIICVLKDNLGYIIVGFICLISGFIIGRQTKTNTTQQEIVRHLNVSDEPTNNSELGTEMTDTCSLLPVAEEIPEDENMAADRQITRPQQMLIQDLKGICFTRMDVERAKKELRGLGLDDLISDAEACLVIINLHPRQKKELCQKGSYVYHMTVLKLNYHKKTMMGIINSEEYLTTGKRSFQTISEMIQFIEDDKVRQMKSNTSNENYESTEISKIRKI